MSTLMMSLGSALSLSSIIQAMITLSICLPVSVSLLYKTTFYVEEYGLTVSFLGVVLVFLTLSLLMLILLISKESSSKYYIMLHILLALLLILCFNTNNLLGFYIFFEACLIPILLMIINWGYQPERLQAGMYMVIYTVISSLPLLAIILYIYSQTATYYILSLNYFNSSCSGVLLLGLFAFMVKLPVYGAHIWLPKAHVEAPLGGSMVLAGVLLKLGGYGMFLYSGVLNYSWSSSSSLFLVFMSLCGGVLASIICLSQSDIKGLIAYSSIVHMSVVMLGLLSSTTWGLYSAVVIMVAHGWASSALFLMAYITYQFVGSRSFTYTKGMLVVMPVLSLMWFVFSMINMSFPPTINFLGEVLIIPVSLMYSWKVFIPVSMLMFMGVLYNMYLYSQINHSAPSGYFAGSQLITSRSLLTLFGHLLPMVLVANMWVLLG